MDTAPGTSGFVHGCPHPCAGVRRQQHAPWRALTAGGGARRVAPRPRWRCAARHFRTVHPLLLTSTCVTVHQAAGVGYQRAADTYERSRPSYPMPVISELADAVRLERGRTVV